MEILWKGETEAADRIRKGTEILANEAGDAAEALAVSVKFWEKEELYVKREGGQVEICCKEPAHYFRALNRALHWPAGQAMEQTETVYFPKNGFMLDCSRNSVFTADTVKALIR